MAGHLLQRTLAILRRTIAVQPPAGNPVALALFGMPQNLGWAWPLSTRFTPIYFRLVFPVPGFVEPRYRDVIKVELRHDSRDALADLQRFEFDSVELCGHLAADSVTDSDTSELAERISENAPSGSHRLSAAR